MKPRYSPEEDAEICRRLAAGETQVMIARSLGRSERALGSHIALLRREMKVTQRRSRPLWSEEEKAAVASMVAEGKTDAEIGAALGRPASGIERMRVILGLIKDTGRPPLTGIKMYLSPWWIDATGVKVRALMGS
jgi:hypothetical protein